MHSISTRALAHRFFAPKALRAGLLPERPTLTLAAFAIALRAIQVTYAGWHTAAYFSEEIHAPERNVVRSVFGGIALVTALYVLVNAAMLHVLSPEQMAASKLPATSERSLLTVLLPARDLRQSLVPNLQRAVQQLLIVLGIPPEIVSREIAAMQPAAFASAVNRRVLGSMNEFAWQVGAYLDRTNDALELARQLSDTPMSAVGSKSRLGIPADVARELLAAHRTGSVRYN